MVLDDGLKTISCGAFDTHSSNMESVKLPKSLKHLGPDNFDTAKSIIIDEIPKKAFVKQLVKNCTLSGVEALNRMAGSSIHATKLEIAGKTVYYDFNAKEAKEYLKRNAKIFALRLIQNKDEERLAKLLKMNIASNQLLKLLLEEAGEMPTARAYILEMLGNTKTNKSFSI